MDPIIMLDSLNYVNRRPRTKPVTGWALLRYFVSLNNPNSRTISHMTNDLWRDIGIKTAYTDLSVQVNQIMHQ
jgi:hypothetical protein